MNFYVELLWLRALTNPSHNEIVCLMKRLRVHSYTSSCYPGIATHTPLIPFPFKEILLSSLPYLPYHLVIDCFCFYNKATLEYEREFRF